MGKSCKKSVRAVLKHAYYFAWPRKQRPSNVKMASSKCIKGLFTFLLTSTLWTSSHFAPAEVPGLPGTNCHTRLGQPQPGIRGPLYWLYASDGYADRATLHNDKAWVSDLQLYVSDDLPYYAWIQVRIDSLLCGGGFWGSRSTCLNWK